MNQSEIIILGANGQLGTALRERYPGAKTVGSSELDITDRDAVEAFDWSGIKYIMNAAAYTNVDGAETVEGRVAAWNVNAQALQNIAHIAWEKDLTVVHISSDYVFDGSIEIHTESEPFTPLGTYGASKAAGDLLVGQLDKFYIVRTSWVIGSGNNFVRSIHGLGPKQISPAVVGDQFGRITFTTEIVRAIDHLLSSEAPYGTYNLSNSGDVVSWADIARQIYEFAGYTEQGLTVSDTTAEAYFADKVSSPRPVHSGLDLSKLEATGFVPRDWRDNLKEYIQQELGQ